MLLLTTVPVLTLTWIAVQNTKASVKTQIIDANVTRVRWAVQYLEEVLLRFDDLFYSLQINDSFVRINEDFEKPTDGASRNAQLELSRLLTASYYSYSALVDQLSYYSHISGQATKIDNKSSGDISYPKTEGPLWKGVFEHPISLSLRLANGRVYALHTVNRFMDQRLQGVFYARVDESLSKKILEILGSTEDSSVFLLNDDLEVLIGHPKKDISKPIMQHLSSLGDAVDRTAVKRTSSHLVFFQPVDGGRLMVAKTVPLSLVNGSASDTAAVGLITGFVLLAASLVLSIVFSLRISRPIVELSESMRQATTPSFDKILGQDRDEIRLLQEGYESLMERMKVLVQKEYEQEIELKDAHLMALQAQINPHFLNNTLNLLGGMALAKGVPEVYTIARAVGDMFRYTVGYQHELVKLSQELNHSKNYLLVQEHRFSGRCKVNVEVDSKVLNTPIPQFILQPIVENAFEHGLQNKKDEWRVTVNGCVQRRGHIIVIEDNGMGMKPEELRALRDKLRNDTDTVKSRRSIGLRNVNARLQLQFGQRFGLRVFSTHGRGTRVVVVLPKDGQNTA
ncbi:MAG: sensor histidine kinase [Spirochaetia bacterium]|nr:sensor histidine kinase [Spirochaetia bacterium]